MTFAAAVVVYNVFCGDSTTCRALEALGGSNISVIIYDNSTKPCHNEDYCRARGWTYLGGTGNVGISKAYNACVDFVNANGGADYLCLFDDDTHLSPAYFSALEQAAQAGGQILVPLIYSGETLLSPCRLDSRYRTVLFSGEEEAKAYTGSDMTAINSGMALSLSLFRDYRYDENIFLDGVDHTFLRDMASKGHRLQIMDYRCDHAFSGYERPSRESAAVRFRIFAKDHKYIFRAQPLSYWLLVGKRALRLTLQYGSPVFLKTLFTTK